MTDVLFCRKCNVKPYTCCGHGTNRDTAYSFGEVKCPNCCRKIRTLSDPGRNSFDVLEEAIRMWNVENEIPFKEKRKCKNCESCVDVGYEYKKACLKNGKCDK